MAFAERMQSTATRLLNKFDEREGDDRIALLVPGAKVWNGTIGEYEIGPDTKYFLTGVELTPNNNMVDGTTVRSGDEFITASVDVFDESGAKVNIVPKVDDKLLIDGVEWSTVATEHVNYTGGGLIVAFKMQVRK